MDMIERVARAIYPTRGKREFKSFTEAFYTEMEAQQLERARAAIAAMREPTSLMTTVGWKKAEERDAILGNGEIAMLWQAMIDAALAEAPNAA